MFTSRAEYRLHLREDNADLRLREKGYAVGLVREKEYQQFKEREKEIERTLFIVSHAKINPTKETNEILNQWGSVSLKKDVSLRELLKRPEIHFQHLITFERNLENTSKAVRKQVEIDAKYDGYAKRQLEQIERFKKLEDVRFPEDFDFASLTGLTTEVKEKLINIKPFSLGPASRSSGA